MPKTKISEWSSTPANNTDIDSINIAEGCAPSGINDAIRELMSQVKDLYAGTSGDIIAVAAGGTGVGTSTGSGSNVLSTSPTLVTPILGTPTSATLTNATGLPISTGVSGLGTGVATALAVNVGSSGAPLVNGGVLGTPSSGTVTNLTGTASININGTVGATTATTGAFTTLSATGKINTTQGGVSADSIGITPTTGTDRGIIRITNTGGDTIFGMDGSTGGQTITGASAYDGIVRSATGLAIGSSGSVWGRFSSSGFEVKQSQLIGYSSYAGIGTNGLAVAGNVGIGTSSPARKLDAQSTTADYQLRLGYNASFYYDIGRVNSNGYLGFYGSQTGATGFTFGGVDGTRMTLDSAGNLGLGVTPSTWDSSFSVLQVRNGSVASTNGEIGIAFNKRYASGDKYIADGYASQYISTNGSHAWYTAPSGTAGNAISFTQAMTLNASGGLQTLNTIGVGNATPSTSGAGITFPATQSASSNANTLDDYEEGTWTPSVGGTATYTTQVGSYTKIGRQVTIWFDLTINLLLTGSTTVISGAPFAPVINTNYHTGTVYWTSVAANQIALNIYIQQYTGDIYFIGTNASTASVTNPTAVIGNGATFRGTLTYYV